MTSVAGVDPSLTGTGVAAADGSLHTVVTGKTATTVAARAVRLGLIRARVCGHVGMDVLVVIEAPGYSRGAEAGAHLRAGLWWLLVFELIDYGCTVIEVSPTALKKFATGRGVATKADMRMALFKRAGLDVADDNQADAWWLRQVGLHLTGSPDAIPLPAAQLAVIEPLRSQLPARLSRIHP